MGWEHDWLSFAKVKKNDEFYTRLEDIENELSHYKQYFQGKTVLCNCDDVFFSNFALYFLKNFKILGLKKLIVTGIPVLENHDRSVLVTKVVSVDGMVGTSLIKRLASIKENTGNSIKSVEDDKDFCAGDFRSEISVALLKESDIVVTNPPFSLFKDFLPLLLKYNKKFIIVGNKNAVTYKEIFPAFMHNEVWIGFTSMNGGQWMVVPKNQEVDTKFKKVLDNGSVLVNIAGVCWFTNLDIEKRHWWLNLTKKYSPNVYRKYDNFDAINVDKVEDIPMDYDGIMGVPITFLDRYNPLEFEIVGKIDFGNLDEYLIANPVVDGNKIYKRIAIKKKNDFSLC